MKAFRTIVFFISIISLFAVAASAQETGGAKGKVRSMKGDALAGATVTARLDGKDIKSVKTDAKGVFELGGLAPGVYNFVFDKNGYDLGVKYNVEIKKKSVVDLGDNLRLAPDKGSLVIINGSVFNQDGRSVTGAEIKVEKLLADGSTKKVGSGYTSSSGEFTMRQPEAAATFRVTASLRGVSASKEIKVDSAGIYRVALTLELPKEGREKN
ncbi:MAG: carboxypeptidase regulatory-like domain-containing protein [Acidobacteria bacterium]|nr:carboxypeptidase regulatory-like domain-containing protein [Acidobacteriota bacterium]